MKDMKDKILSFVLSLPRWARIVVIIAAAMCATVVLFCSCSSSFAAQMPSIKDNKIGAEGVVSKEKNITKQTKWYFKPDEPTNTFE